MIKKSFVLIITLIFIISAFFGFVSAMNPAPNTAPISVIEYFTNTNEKDDVRMCFAENGIKKAYLNYDDVVGHGNSADKNKIIEIQFKLDNTAKENSVCDDGACNEIEEQWHTRTLSNLDDGWHKLWGRATDINNLNETFSDNNLCEFCIDTKNPPISVKPAPQREEFCDPNYINNEEGSIKFTWTATDNGCAPVSFFDVFVELDFNNDLSADETRLIEEITESMINLDELELEDKDAVRIRVRAIDRAGNVGEWSEFSDWVFIDNEMPMVEITNENADEWVMGNLEITEIDEDENLFKCFYKVQNGFLNQGGKVTVDWTPTDCNKPFTINTGEVCPVDGKNKCIVFKKAQDKACNEIIRSKQFDIDNNPPILEKIIGEPNYFNGQFLTTETPIEIIARDSGSGVRELCYQINNNEPRCFKAENDTTFMLCTIFNFEEESEHNLKFWATDNKGTQAIREQTHFVDETPPMTMKSYTNLFIEIKDWAAESFVIKNFMFDWIGLKSKIILEANDPEPHPSGLNRTLFKIFELNEGSEGHTEWYGENNKKWYDNPDSCEEANQQRNQVFRVEGTEAEEFEDEMLFAASEAIEHDPFKLGASPLGPFPKGDELEFTLEEWLAAGGSGTYMVNGSNAIMDFRFTNLVENGVYTVWCSRLTFPPNFNVVDKPCGAENGSQNTFVADKDGEAAFNLALETLLQSTEETVTLIALAYHSDDSTCGSSPCDFGLNSHVQIFSIVPAFNTIENESTEIELTFVNHIQAGLPEQDVFVEKEENECVPVLGWADEEWQTYNSETGIMISEEESEGPHKICFFSEDNLGNVEGQMCQVFFVDNIGPSIRVLNPTELEAANIEKCVQSVVALVNDDGTGIKRVWAELWDDNNTKVREVEMTLRPDGTYDALIDKQLPVGEYSLKVKAEDNVGNVNVVEIEEELLESVFVEFISPATCSIDPEDGGECEFTFNVCMRGGNSTKFWLDKLGDVITPGMMDATISKGEESAFVGLLDEGIDSGLLVLSDEIINGRTSFNLNLNIPADVASQIGTGSHKLNYLIKSFR